MHEDVSAAPAGCLKNICVSLNSVVKSHPQLSWYTFPGRCTLFIIDKLFAFFLFIQFLISISPENTVVSAAVSKDGTRQDCEYAEKCSQSTFRSVAELSLGSERISEMAVVDMVFLLSFSPFIYLKKVLCQNINLFIFTG